MRYNGDRLRKLLTGNAALRDQVYAYLNKGNRKGLDYYYGVDINITIGKLSDIMAATKKPIEFFVDFEEGEHQESGRVSGTGNVVNSTVVQGDATVNHLREVIRLKDEIISEKERIINIKDERIASINKKYDDVLALINSDKIGTKSI